jgi:predicted MFS family arabinose efflux permease
MAEVTGLTVIGVFCLAGTAVTTNIRDRYKNKRVTTTCFLLLFMTSVGSSKFELFDEKLCSHISIVI